MPAHNRLTVLERVPYEILGLHVPPVLSDENDNQHHRGYGKVRVAETVNRRLRSAGQGDRR